MPHPSPGSSSLAGAETQAQTAVKSLVSKGNQVNTEEEVAAEGESSPFSGKGEEVIHGADGTKSVVKQQSETDQQPSSGDDEVTATPETSLPTNGDWAAVWSPEANAYYFWNSKTNETTWSNPFETPGASSSSSTESAPPLPIEPMEESQPPLPHPTDQYSYHGIDPDLAYLDPNLAYGVSSSGGGGTGQYSFKAAFNSRTGRFQSETSGFNPDRVSEHERMKRQASFYFDYDGWQKVKEANQEVEVAAGEPNKKKPKRLTKKEVEMFKARKEEKKRKHALAWLSN